MDRKGERAPGGLGGWKWYGFVRFGILHPWISRGEYRETLLRLPDDLLRVECQF